MSRRGRRWRKRGRPAFPSTRSRTSIWVSGSATRRRTSIRCPCFRRGPPPLPRRRPRRRPHQHLQLLLRRRPRSRKRRRPRCPSLHRRRLLPSRPPLRNLSRQRWRTRRVQALPLRPAVRRSRWARRKGGADAWKLGATSASRAPSKHSGSGVHRKPALPSSRQRRNGEARVTLVPCVPGPRRANSL